MAQMVKPYKERLFGLIKYFVRESDAWEYAKQTGKTFAYVAMIGDGEQ